MKEVKYVRYEDVEQLLSAIAERSKYREDTAYFELEDKNVKKKIQQISKNAVIINEANFRRADAELYD